MIRRDIRVRIKREGRTVSSSIDKEGGRLSRISLALTTIRALARVICPVKIGPCVSASSTVGSVRAPGRFRACICRPRL